MVKMNIDIVCRSEFVTRPGNEKPEKNRKIPKKKETNPEIQTKTFQIFFSGIFLLISFFLL